MGNRLAFRCTNSCISVHLHQGPSNIAFWMHFDSISFALKHVSRIFGASRLHFNKFDFISLRVYFGRIFSGFHAPSMHKNFQARFSLLGPGLAGLMRRVLLPASIPAELRRAARPAGRAGRPWSPAAAPSPAGGGASTSSPPRPARGTREPGRRRYAQPQRRPGPANKVICWSRGRPCRARQAAGRRGGAEGSRGRPGRGLARASSYPPHPNCSLLSSCGRRGGAFCVGAPVRQGRSRLRLCSQRPGSARGVAL